MGIRYNLTIVICDIRVVLTLLLLVYKIIYINVTFSPTGHQSSFLPQATSAHQGMKIVNFYLWYLQQKGLQTAEHSKANKRQLAIKQCDQIGRFSKVLGEIFCFKSSPNVQWLLGNLEKCPFWDKNWFGNILGNFWKIWATFNFSIWSHCNQVMSGSISTVRTNIVKKQNGFGWSEIPQGKIKT